MHSSILNFFIIMRSSHRVGGGLSGHAVSTFVLTKRVRRRIGGGLPGDAAPIFPDIPCGNNAVTYTPFLH
jgi:hypothetical protein